MSCLMHAQRVRCSRNPRTGLPVLPCRCVTDATVYSACATLQVILTSYDTLRVDAAALNYLHPHAVMFDEAHKLKNAKSKQYEAAQSLTTRYRYGLSGEDGSSCYLGH